MKFNEVVFWTLVLVFSPVMITASLAYLVYRFAAAGWGMAEDFCDWLQ